MLSPRPTMMPLLVSTSGSSRRGVAEGGQGPFVAVLGLDAAEEARGRFRRWWLRISGRAFMTMRRAASSPLKSGMSTSMLQPGWS